MEAAAQGFQDCKVELELDHSTLVSVFLGVPVVPASLSALDFQALVAFPVAWEPMERQGLVQVTCQVFTAKLVSHLVQEAANLYPMAASHPQDTALSVGVVADLPLVAPLVK